MGSRCLIFRSAGDDGGATKTAYSNLSPGLTRHEQITSIPDRIKFAYWVSNVSEGLVILMIPAHIMGSQEHPALCAHGRTRSVTRSQVRGIMHDQVVVSREGRAVALIKATQRPKPTSAIVRSNPATKPHTVPYLLRLKYICALGSSVPPFIGIDTSGTAHSIVRRMLVFEALVCYDLALHILGIIDS